MLKRTLAFILLGVVLAGAGAAYVGGFSPASENHGERGHDGNRDHHEERD